MLYIGIDLGTSAVKLLLSDEKGDIKNIVSRDYPLDTPQAGWAEQNPSYWVEGVYDGISSLLDGLSPSDVAGIAVAGQMHGLVVLDENDEIIRPAILWNDGRTSKQTDFLNNVVGREKLCELTGNIAFAGFTAPKLLWMKENEPKLFERIRKIMLPKDYLVYILTGIHSTDVSDASGTLFFDVRNKCWSKEMLEICGIREQQLGKIFESHEPVGTVKLKIAEKFGFRTDVKVAAGAGDNAAAAVGNATVGEGGCNISVGTSGTVFVSSKNFVSDNVYYGLHSFAHSDGGFHLLGCVLSAASCNKWWQNLIINTKDYKGEEAKIKDDSLSENDVYFLPYLMGERSPHNNSSARGMFIGMTINTTREDMTLAMLEGVAFAIRDCIEIAKNLGIDIKKSNICGGGAKSKLWCKIFANILGIELDIVNSPEGPGFGAAMLAMVACGEYESVYDCAKKLVKIVETVKPDAELTKKYEEKYLKFRKIYPSVKPLYEILKS